MWGGLRRFFGILGLTSNWQYMLATISGSVTASLLTKFMYLHDEDNMFQLPLGLGAVNLAKYVKECDRAHAHAFAKVVGRTNNAQRVANLGSLHARRRTEHI